MIETNDFSYRYFFARLDTSNRNISLSQYQRSYVFRGLLTYNQPSETRLVLQGDIDGQKIRVELERIGKTAFLLQNRGFNWINETPFNR